MADTTKLPNKKTYGDTSKVSNIEDVGFRAKRDILRETPNSDYRAPKKGPKAT